LPKFTGSTTIGNSQVFDNGTQVGIGTASPTSLLQIGTGDGASSTRTTLQFSNGGFSTTNLPSAPGSFSNGDKLIFWDDGSGKSSIGVGNGYNMILQSTGAGNSDIQFFTGTSGAGTERMRITSGGNVGIACTPEVPFEVHAGRTTNPPALGTKGGTMALLFNDSANGSYGLLIGLAGANSYIQSQRTDGSAFAFNLLLQPNGGNVLIGTTSDNGYLLRTADKGTTSTNAYFGTGNVRIGGGADAGSNQVLSIAPGVVGVDAPGVGNGRFIINATGNVGIGTASPTPISTYTTLEIRGATGGGIKIGKTAFAQFNIQHDGTDAYLNNTANGALYIFNNDAEKLSISSGGIIKSLPTYNNSTGLAANMQIDSNGFMARSTVSSQRFKENIIDWSGGLDVVMALKPRTFKYKKDYYDKADIDFLGLIAEEVSEVCPYLVDYENEDRTGQEENVRYSNIVVPLIKAIQELKTEIDSLKNQIK
jgi:hypothetical protein